MPKTDKNTKYYDLTMSQHVVHYALTYSIHKQAMNVAVCLYIKNELDAELFKKAVRAEIGRNDSLRLYFKKFPGKVRQYFLSPEEAAKLPLNIATADFTGKTKEEQDAFLRRDAAVPVHYAKDEIYRFIFFKSYDGRNGLYFVVCHLNMDAISVFMTLQDLFALYTALKENTEMPKPFNAYKDHIEREQVLRQNKPMLEKNKDFYLEQFRKNGEPIYCSPSGSESLEKLRKRRLNPKLRSFPVFHPLQDKSTNIGFHFTPEFTKQIDCFCESEGIPPQSFFLFAVRSYISKINGNTEDLLHSVVCNRRATVADKNTFGCMASGVWLRTIVGGGTTLRDALSYISTSVAQSFRHTHWSSIQATFALQKMYKTFVFDHYVSFLMSYLGFGPLNGWEYDAQWISNGRFAMGLYCVVMHRPSDGGYDVFYEYRTKLMNAEHITALHDGMTEILRLSMENPDSAVSEILNKVK